MMMAQRRCEECGAEGVTMHCINCKAVFFCSKDCQMVNWKRVHKRVCSTDPKVRQFIPVEMTIERALATLPKIKAPKEARCYICLEGDRKSSKLMRGCACRGDSAGYVHLDCVVEHAVSKEATGDMNIIFDGWTSCVNCKQRIVGPLGIQMSRRFWQRHRSSQHQVRRYNSTTILADTLTLCNKTDAANHLLTEASKYAGDDRSILLNIKLRRATMLTKNGQKLEALELLQATLPEAKADTERPHHYASATADIAELLVDLDRGDESYDMATEAVEFTKVTYGPEHSRTLAAIGMYARVCAEIGRVDESKAIYDKLLATETRVFGRDHIFTQETRNFMYYFGFAATTS